MASWRSSHTELQLPPEKRLKRSDSWWSDVDPVASLPYEVASCILDYVPPHQLVRVCMLVSRSWKTFLSEPVFWKVRMRHGGNYSSRLDTIVGIDWPRLCFNTIYEPNLIKSFNKKGELSFDWWKCSSDDWSDFRWDSEKVHKRLSYNWAIESGRIPESNSDLIKEHSGCLKNYVTSCMWCCRDQVFELAKFGFNDDIMDCVQPVIEVSEWFAARQDCGSIFCMRVELVDANLKVVEKFEDSETTDQWQGGHLGWRKMKHKFSGYGSGVRYLRFADAGKSTLYWGGHFGSKMAAAWVRIWLSETM